VGVGLLFAIAAFFAPIAGIIPACATAPALIAVGFLMSGAITRIDFTDPETAVPSFLTLLLIPLTWSIAHGIGFGAITYVGMAVLRGHAGRVHPVMYGVALAFGLFFALAG
jgi:AGZA family xanthine/uracil permease-like MFS transporter